MQYLLREPMLWGNQVENLLEIEDNMPNRLVCNVLEEMSKCSSTNNYSYLDGLIEEIQTLVNRMEAKLFDMRDIKCLNDEIQKKREEVNRLEQKVELLEEKEKFLTQEPKQLPKRNKKMSAEEGLRRDAMGIRGVDTA